MLFNENPTGANEARTSNSRRTTTTATTTTSIARTGRERHEHRTGRASIVMSVRNAPGEPDCRRRAKRCGVVVGGTGVIIVPVRRRTVRVCVCVCVFVVDDATPSPHAPPGGLPRVRCTTSMGMVPVWYKPVTTPRTQCKKRLGKYLNRLPPVHLPADLSWNSRPFVTSHKTPPEYRSGAFYTDYGTAAAAPVIVGK